MVKAILGLHGPSGVGKDTLADALARSFGYINVKFATGIRLKARELGIYCPKEQEISFQVSLGGHRHTVQEWLLLVASWYTCQDPYYWAREVYDRTKDIDNVLVFSDLRSAAELHWLETNRALCITMVRETMNHFQPFDNEISLGCWAIPDTRDSLSEQLMKVGNTYPALLYMLKLQLENKQHRIEGELLPPTKGPYKLDLTEETIETWDTEAIFDVIWDAAPRHYKREAMRDAYEINPPR